MAQVEIDNKTIMQFTYVSFGRCNQALSSVNTGLSLSSQHPTQAGARGVDVEAVLPGPVRHNHQLRPGPHRQVVPGRAWVQNITGWHSRNEGELKKRGLANVLKDILSNICQARPGPTARFPSMAWRQPTRPAGGPGGGGEAGLVIISGMCSTLATGGGAEMIVHASATKLGPVDISRHIIRCKMPFTPEKRV